MTFFIQKVLFLESVIAIVKSLFMNRESRGYWERGGIKVKRAGSGGEGLGLIPTEGYMYLLSPIFYPSSKIAQPRYDKGVMAQKQATAW